MKRNLIQRKIWGLSASVLLLAACATDKAIQVNPQQVKLTPDSAGQVDLAVDIEVPGRYVSRRSRLIIVPQLMQDNRMQVEFDPLVLDAPVYSKKKKRMERLEGWEDPYASFVRPYKGGCKGESIPYRQKLELPDGGRDGQQIWGVVTTDGCGECTAMDTVLLATISNPAELIKKEGLKLEWMEPEFVIRPKIRQGKGMANLQFVINRYDIRLDLGNNRSEMERMLETLQPIVEDTLAELTSVQIYGLASADGPLRINVPLARNRAAAAKEWLFEKLPLTALQKQVFSSSSRPEGWEPVVQAMYEAGDKDSVAVRDILNRFPDSNDDVHEKYIRKLSCWPHIRENYLQKDRKVAYVYTYTVKSFTTDAELLDMYEKRPDAFNEEEMLRVSTLKKESAEKKAVYRKILYYFPQSEVAANNLAILLMREGKPQEAELVLHQLDSLSEQALNTLAATYVYQNKYEHAVELLQVAADASVEGRYNLGLIRAMQRRFDEAYALLEPYRDVNTAVLALSLNKNDEAQSIMESLADKTPVCAYIRAMIAARKQDRQALYEHLSHAISVPELKTKAKGEFDFMPYQEDESWIKLFETESRK